MGAKRGRKAEIEVTPEMIAAGLRVLTPALAMQDYSEIEEELAEAFRAMYALRPKSDP